MKNHYLTIPTLFLILIGSALNAQVAIGKENISNPTVSLEFGDGNRGLILPWVDSQDAVTNAVDGTLIFDTKDRIIKVKQGGNWISYTNATNGKVNTDLQKNLQENATARVSIGKLPDPANQAPGILVLEDNNKAMILPKVKSPHLNISNPEPGTVVFDTDKQQVAMFNGTEWVFWN